jgi:glycosyltransferase involved in cell wall biosynthesis
MRLRRLDDFRLAHDLLLRRSYEQAGCVIGIGEYVRDILGDIAVQKFHAMTDIGILGLPRMVDRRGRTGTVRVLFVGRIVRSKGVRNAIRAMALLGEADVRLDILGEGPDFAACADLVRSLGLEGSVTMHGRLPRERVDDFYAQSDIFLFPSYREPGGLVVAEAMSHGLPCIVCGRGGPADTVDDRSGIRVAPDGEDGYERGLAEALGRLVRDPALRRSLGEGGRARIAEIGLWREKADVVDGLYADVLSSCTNSWNKTGGSR